MTLIRRWLEQNICNHLTGTKTTNVVTKNILIMFDDGNDFLKTIYVTSFAIDFDASFHNTPYRDSS